MPHGQSLEVFCDRIGDVNYHLAGQVPGRFQYSWHSTIWQGQNDDIG